MRHDFDTDADSEVGCNCFFWRLNYLGVIIHFNAVCIMRFRLEYEPHACLAERRNHLHDMCHRNVRSLEPTISRENLFSFELPWEDVSKRCKEAETATR